MQNLTLENVQKYIAALKKKGLSREMIQRKLASVQQFLEWFLASSSRTDVRDLLDVKRFLADARNDIDRVLKRVEGDKKGWLNGILEKLPKHHPERSEGSDHNRILRSTQNDTGLGIQHYIGIALVLVLMATLGAGAFNQFFNKAQTPFAFPSQLTKPSQRYISFQGRVTDSLGNPITTATNFQFKLFTIKTVGAGTPLYTAGTCSLPPDLDGILNVLVGGSGLSTDQNVCGNGIPDNVFTDFPNVYLGIFIGGSLEEMSPRQQIANVGYAVNAETLQGFPPGTGKSTIPYLDLNGDVLIATSGASIKSLYESANFTLASSNNLVLQSAGPAAGAGDIILQASGSGALRFRTAGANSDTFTRIFVANGGNVGVGNTTASQLLTVGSSEQFKVDSSGNTTTSGNISTSGTGTGTFAGLLTASNGLTLTTGALNLTSTSGTAAFTLSSSTTAFNVQSGLFDIDTTNSKVGIGTTSPTSKLHVTGAITGKALSIFDETGDQSPLVASESGTPVFTIAHPTGTIVNGFTLTPSVTTAGVAFAATGTDTNIALSIDSKGTGALNLNNTATGDVLLAGGSGATGCTVTNSTGALACSGAITTTATSGNQGWWNRTGTTLSPVTAGDAVTTSGNISTTGTGTGTFAGLLTASNGLTLTTGALNLTATSGTAALTLTSSLTAFNVNSGIFDIDTTNSRVGIGTAAPGATLDIQSTRTSGNLAKVSATSAVTQAGVIIGMTTDLSNYTPSGGFDLTANNIKFPSISIGAADANNYTLTGYDTTSGTTPTITQAGAGVVSSYGINLQIPNIVQTAGTVNAWGMRITTGSITTGGVENGIRIVASGVGAGSLTGVNISTITTPGAGTETAISIGSGWDNAININSGALTLNSNAIDSSGALSLGTTNATSIAIGRTGITTAVTGALTQTYTGTGTASTFTANSVTTGNAFTFSATGITTGNIIEISAPTGLTQGSLIDMPALTVAHTTGGAANLINLAFTEASTNTNGNTTNGIRVQSNLNFVPGSIATTGVVGVQSDFNTFTSCANNSSTCNVLAFRTSIPSISLGVSDTATVNMTGFKVASGTNAFTVNNGSSVLTFAGADIASPNIVGTLGTVSATGVNVANGNVNTSGTQTGVAISTAGITTAGTQNGISITSSANAANGSLNAIKIGQVGGASTSKIALNVDQGWNTFIQLKAQTAYTQTAQDFSGAVFDYNTNYTPNVGSNITGYDFKSPTATISQAGTTSTSYTGYSISTAGGLITQTQGTPSINWTGASFALPTISNGRSGTVAINGIILTVPSNIISAATGTTTANVISVPTIATGPAAGTLTGINIGNITTPGVGTETAISIGSGWDTVLTVGGTTILNTTGVLQSAGLSGTYSNALTLSNVSNSITAGTLTATGGTINGTSVGATTPSTGAFTTLTSSGNTTLATGASTTNTVGSGASSINTIGSTTTPGALTLHGATTLDNTFTVSGAQTGLINNNTGTYALSVTVNPAGGAGLSYAPNTWGILSRVSDNANSISKYGVISYVSSTGTGNKINFYADNDNTGTLYSLYSSSSNAILYNAGPVGINNTSPVAKLDVQGAVTGKALTIFNETGDQAPLVASESGTPVFTIAHPAGTIVNGFTLTPSVTTAGVAFAATGTDTNIALSIDSKGTGALNLGPTNATSVVIGRASQTLQLKSFSSIAANGVVYLSDTSGTVAETAASTGAQCLQTSGVGTAPIWGACGSGGATALSSITAATTTNTIANANFAQTWNWGTLTTETGMTFGGGTAMTSGSIFALGGATYVHTSLNDIGSLAKITFTDASTNANNGGVTNGLNIASTLNTSGAGTKTINAATIAAPTITACTTGACTWNGLQVNTLTSGPLSTLTSNGVNIVATGISAGTLTGINISGITAGAGTQTAMAVGSGWNTVLTVGGTTILNTTGVLQSAGLSGTYSNALTLSNVSNSITAGTLTATGGTINGTTIGGTTPAAGTFTTLTANTSLTLAANAGITMNSGTGVFAQTYSNAAAGSADTKNITNANTGVSTITVNGLDLTLTNSTNTNNTNTLNGIAFEAASNNNTNVINGINFLSATGFTNFLKTPSVSIDSSGNINGANIGATTAGTGKFTTLTSTGATDLANAGASNVTIATTGTGTVAIGNATGTFVLTSNGGLNVTTAGVLSGITGYTQGSGTFSFTSATATGNIFSLTNNSVTTGNLLNLSSTATGLTTGSLISAGSPSYNHTVLNETGNLVGLTFTDASTNTNNGGVTSGLNIASTINTSGAGTKTINATNIAAPTITACTTGACTWNGVSVNTLTSGPLSTLTSNGLNITATGISAGTLNGLNISSITAGAGTETALNVGTGWDIGINVAGGAWEGGTTARTIDAFTTNTTTTITDLVGLGYRVANDIGTTAGVTVTATYNFTTGIQDVNNAFYIFSTEAKKGVSATASNSQVEVQINGVRVGLTSTGSGTPATDKFHTFLVIKMGGTWRSLNTNLGNNDVADLAENIPYVGEKSPQPGQIVSIANTDVAIQQSKSAYDNKAVGVVSTNPAILLSDQTDHAVGVALTGRIPVIVTSLNGKIQNGDYITTSDLTGIGMKQTLPGKAVGQALESFDPTQKTCTVVASYPSVNWPEDDGSNPAHPCFKIPVSSFDSNTQGILFAKYHLSANDSIYVGKVMLIAGSAFADPGYTLTSTGDLQIALNQQNQNNDESQKFNLLSSTGEVIKRIGAYSELAVAYVKTGFINAQKILAENITSTNKITSPIVETTDIKASGEAQLNQISTNVIKPQEQDVTVDLSQKSASESGPLARILVKGLDGKTVSTIDAAGNASFSGTLAAKEATISGTIAAGKVETNEASITGKLTAKEIESDTINQLRDRLTLAAADSGQARMTSQELSTSVNNIQSLLADIRKQPLSDPQYYQNLDNNPVVSSLTVSGDTTLYNATIANSLTAGTISIENNQLISLTTELKLSALSTVNILDGAVVIARDGTMTTKGTIIAKGGIVVENSDLRFKNKEGVETAQIDSSGSAKFKSLALDKYLDATSSAIIATPEENFNKNGLFASAIETQKQTAGLGIVPVDSNEIVIYNQTVKDDSLIYLTPTTQTSPQLTVSQKQSCGPQSPSNCKPYFKVTSSQPIHPDVGFNWLIIN